MEDMGINVPNWLDYMKLACFMIVLSNKVTCLTCMELMRTELFMDDPGIFGTSVEALFFHWCSIRYTQYLLERSLDSDKFHQEYNYL